MTPLVLLLQLAFYLVFAATLWQYATRRGPLELRVAAVFATSATLFAVATLIQLDNRFAPLRQLSVVILLAQPLAVTWLIDLVAPLRRGAMAATSAAFLVLSVAYLAFGPRHAPTVLAIVAYFAVVETLAGIRLIREGFGRFGLPRLRLTLAGLSTFLFALAIVVSGLAAAASGGQRASDNVTTASRSIALLAGLGYLAAFAPPQWLRRTAQRAIAFDLSSRLVAIPTGSDPGTLWRELAMATRDVLGASGVEVSGADGESLAELGHASRDAAEAAGNPREPYSRVEIPIPLERGGTVRVVASVAGRPLFVDDDLAIIRHLGSLTARAVEREEAIVSLARAGRQLEESEAVRASEARFRALLDANPGAILALDADGRVGWATRQAAELFGYPWDELVGMQFGRLVTSHDEPRSSGGDRPLVRLEAVAHRMDGGTFPAELALTEVELDGQRVELAVVSDATWRHEADQLRERFLGVLSHELRTPVTSIYGGTQLMLSRGSRLDEETRRELLAGVAAESERLQRMVENLLVLARIERGGDFSGPRPVLLDRVLRDLLERERSFAPEATISLSIPRPLPMVAADEEYLAQIIRNLLSNAVKYAGSGARIDVEALPGDEDVVVRVLDDGPGIAADEAERVFGLYFRSSSAAASAPGAGIGLFVCRELIAAMGGRIWAQPRSAGGSEFGFSLPIYAEDLEPEEHAMPTPTALIEPVTAPAASPALANP